MLFASAWAPDARFLRYRFQHVGMGQPTPKSPDAKVTRRKSHPTPKSPGAKLLADPTRVIYLYSTGFFNALGPKTGALGDAKLPDASSLAFWWNIGSKLMHP